MMNRRHFLHLALAAASAPLLQGAEHLPQNITFVGQTKFQAIVAQAIAGNWAALPMGTRVAQFGQAMRGT